MCAKHVGRSENIGGYENGNTQTNIHAYIYICAYVCAWVCACKRERTATKVDSKEIYLKEWQDEILCCIGKMCCKLHKCVMASSIR